MYTHFCNSLCELQITYFPDISAAMSQTTSTVAGSSSDYQVDLGDCVTGTVYTSITRLDIQPISGHLVLSSAASTYVCSFTIKSVFVPSISRQITNCTRSKFFYE